MVTVVGTERGHIVDVYQRKWGMRKALLHSLVSLYSNQTTPYSSIFDAKISTNKTKAVLSPIEYIAL